MWNVSPVPPLPTSLLFSLTKHGQSYESRAVHIDTRTFAHIMNILKQEGKEERKIHREIKKYRMCGGG